MLKTIVFLFTLCAISTAFPVGEDENGDKYILIPLSRERRQTTYDITKSAGGGTRVDLGHKGVVFDDGNNKVLAGGTLSKTFHPNTPLTYGGTVDYTHERSGSGLSVGAQRTPGYGTDLGVQGKYNIWREGKATLDAVGSYNRHYGGPIGTGSPNWYGGVQLSVPFGR